MKNISIIGSTGSIGTQALDIVRANGDINVVALACGKNIELIEKQARETTLLEPSLNTSFPKARKCTRRSTKCLCWGHPIAPSSQGPP